MKINATEIPNFRLEQKYILYNTGKYILNGLIEKLRSPNKKLTAADYISLAAGVAKTICDLRSANSSKYDVAEKCLEKDITDIINSGKTSYSLYAFDENAYKIKDTIGKTHDVNSVLGSTKVILLPLL